MDEHFVHCSEVLFRRYIKRANSVSIVRKLSTLWSVYYFLRFHCNVAKLLVLRKPTIHTQVACSSYVHMYICTVIIRQFLWSFSFVTIYCTSGEPHLFFQKWIYYCETSEKWTHSLTYHNHRSHTQESLVNCNIHLSDS